MQQMAASFAYTAATERGRVWTAAREPSPRQDCNKKLHPKNRTAPNSELRLQV